MKYLGGVVVDSGVIDAIVVCICGVFEENFCDH